MPTRINIDNGVMSVLLEGEIDHHTARLMREQIDTQAEKCHPSRMLLDFSGVSFMDSSGIGLIMGRHRLMNELGGSLKVQNPPPSIARMIKLAGLGRLNVM